MVLRKEAGDIVFLGPAFRWSATRVAIARSLCMTPNIMLDKPTSALDPEMIKEVLAVMFDLANTEKRGPLQ